MYTKKKSPSDPTQQKTCTNPRCTYVEGKGPSPKLAFGMVQSCKSQARQDRAGLKCRAGRS